MSLSRPLSHEAAPSRWRRAGRRLAAVAVALVATAPLVQAAPTATAAPQWKLVMQDHFYGTKIDYAKWGVYNGGNGGDRVAQNTIVRDGKLVLRTTKVNGVWKGAGVSAARGNKQTYGKYLMRVRFDRGYGVRVAALLWPADGVWPPEVDFYEIPAKAADRQVNTLTNHYGTRGNHKMMHESYRGDFTKWHVVGVEWTPWALRFTMDGKVMRVMKRNIPQKPMWLGIQTRPGSDMGAQPNSTTPRVVDLEVDWVKIFRKV